MYNITTNSYNGLLEVTIYQRDLAALVLAFGHHFEPLNFFRWDHPHAHTTYSFMYDHNQLDQYAHKLDLMLWQRTATHHAIKTIAEQACSRTRFARLSEIESVTNSFNLTFLFYQRTTHLLRLPKHLLTAPMIPTGAYQNEEKFGEFVYQWLMTYQ